MNICLEHNIKKGMKMNIYIKKVTIVISAFLLLVHGVSDAKMKSVKSRRDFEQTIAKDSMVVALFYNESDKGLTQMYEDVSKVQKYDEADVIFLRVNVARSELSQLAQLYHVTTMPTFLFFHKGKQVTSVSGNISRTQLQSSIDQYFGTEITQYISGKNVRNSNRLAQEKESWKVYYYPRDIFVNSYGPEERDLE
jgi:thioredoxin-like negative regulator of GroEL